ncbi:LysR family transcriptional regulator [Photobacterium sp. WH77]|uniref:LysR family transcriptional regulator n=1 Tax=Photobacterium arenosum TaxID=2774143 RepID=A0ABR9BHC9_9GAMM|nr:MULTISPECIES: LysR family transcriptional regulator [Photobacterium]MBD8511966.1 LysR family transcriptional regulator [Photobacterium arenosum]MBV7261327.1 LysR family transcriptional regulator [Photobacterium sp. WH24]MCG2836227.1 LysR family transcriptional regulator [Photobacterium sp. WH77]MCG2843636.1 LysR family transcriptional regulator [Photobacterium sp. WH80]
MHDLNDLYYFVQAVDHGGFTHAGKALGIPKSKLSRRIANLEDKLGVRLIQRTTRQFIMTEIGRAYYEHCKAMLVEAEAAQEVIETTRAEPRGVIRITCPVALLHQHIGLMLADFMAMYPQITIHLEATNRRVDVVKEAIDIAIRVRPPPIQDSELVMRILAVRGQCLVASPDLIRQLNPPVTPHDLTTLPSLGLSSQQKVFTWKLFSSDQSEITVQHTPRFITTDMIALRTAALAGVGIVQLPLLMVQKQLKQGLLVRVVPDWSPHQEIIHAIFPTRRGLLPSVRTLINYLAQRFNTIDEE